MASISYCRAILLSLYSVPLYQEAGTKWKGRGFAYLGVLLLFCTVLTTLNTAQDIFTRLEPITGYLPSFQIKQGTFSIASKEPLILTDPVSLRPSIIIDTSGTYRSLDLAEADLLITPKEIIYRASARNIYRTSFSKWPDMVVNPARGEQTLRKLRLVLAAGLFPFCYGGAWVYRCLELFFFGAMGLALASQQGKSLSLDASMRLSALANTPAIILSTLLSSLGVFDPWHLLLQENVHIAWIDLWFVPVLFVLYFTITLALLRRGIQSLASHATERKD